MTHDGHIPYQMDHLDGEEVLQRAQSIFEHWSKRRSVRFFSDKEVSQEVIDHLIATAGTAPSGANKQPWTFCAVSDPHLKKQIRQAAEEEEKAFYSGRAPDTWLEDLATIGTDWEKPFLETAPWLIIVFKQVQDVQADGTVRKNYYVSESVGIACGLLIAAIHEAGLATLTHTPSPMNFLGEILGRPAHEKPFLLLPVGYVAEDATVPDIQRKDLDSIRSLYSPSKRH
ncbi:MAG: nitroreductase family protein [Schleiferiaceae bacterium]|nr:nitroreductase family protein [Schleiferiaceae bacterium]